MISPIAHKLEQISVINGTDHIDKKILDNTRNTIWREDNEHYIESGLFEFVSSFSVAAKNDPPRFRIWQ